jgi:hypothetical protein
LGNQKIAIIDNEMLWAQFGAAIDMLGDALRDCPDELWEKRLWEDHPDQWVATGFSAFWYLGYHSLFWLDLYLTGAEEGFTPPSLENALSVAQMLPDLYIDLCCPYSIFKETIQPLPVPTPNLPAAGPRHPQRLTGDIVPERGLLPS